MTEKNKNILAVMAAAAIACTLGGCGQEKQESIDRAEFMATLPSVTAFSLEAQSLRAEQTQTDTIEEETVTAVPEDSAVTTAVSFEDEPEDETWKEGLSFPEASDIDDADDNAVPEGEGEGEGGEAASEAETSGETQTESPADTAVTTAAGETARETVPPQTETAVSNASATEETIPVSPAAAVNAVPGTTDTVSAPSQEYDKEFFSSDLFIGDSISTGYSLYGFMDEKNVYAKIGLNPSSVLTKTVPTVYGDIGAADMVGYTLPKRVYIMLGSNGIQWLTTDSMLKSMRSLTEMISLTSPETEIVIVGVPPVTAGYDSTVDNMDVMSAVNEYNSGLSAFAAECGYIYVDPGEILKDSSGYFNSAYAEKDGMHFKSATYKMLLSYLQTRVTEAETAAAAKQAAEEEAARKRTEIEEFAENAGVDDTFKNAVTVMPSEFVTIPEESVAEADLPAEDISGDGGADDSLEPSGEKIED